MAAAFTACTLLLALTFRTRQDPAPDPLRGEEPIR